LSNHDYIITRTASGHKDGVGNLAGMPTDTPDPDRLRAHARSFDRVADAYDRGRPGYPSDAAAWLLGSGARRVLELGAGTGKLTGPLLERGPQVVATDPSAQMLEHLRAHHPHAWVLRAAAEHIPLPPRSVDVVVAGQAFHWFDLERALPEIARVLTPGGRIALAWNVRDERVPWVRRLGDLVGRNDLESDPTHALLGSHLFGYVDTATFRTWQPLGRSGLRDLVTSRSQLAVLDEPARQRTLDKVDRLYDDYGRGPDGMLLPYLTRCYSAVVRAPAVPDPPRRPGGPGGPGETPGDEDGTLLIDFR
jgi:SAM-dependent methyltransferase